jgi:hypothetical protein
VNEKQKQWLVTIPPVYQQNYKIAISGKSRAAAIKAKCLDCTNFQRVEVADCLVETCPLWPYRPYRSSEKPRSPQKSRTLEKKTVRG